MSGPARARRPVAGFTLTELMVVVAIIGVLASGAVAGYRLFAAKAREVEGETALRRLKQHQDDHYINHVVYSDDLVEIGFPPLPPLKYYSVGVVLDETDPVVAYRATATPLPDYAELRGWVLTQHRDRTFLLERL
jgi:prepilin-type N-terminal cleavage/methylation domain-containing protein